MPYKYMKFRSIFFRNNAERNSKCLTEDDFKKGMKFNAKYIGSLEIPRPVSRVEIVAAMRKVRFEFQVKCVKKKKVVLTVSVDGVKVHLGNKKRKQCEDSFISHHAISKIFYVSHDSQDLKIFSYITSNETSKIFKCNVFKSYKMAQAVQIVKAIGQAFDVCHKMTIENNKEKDNPQENEENGQFVQIEDARLTSPSNNNNNNSYTKSWTTNNDSLQMKHSADYNQFSSTLPSTDKYKIINTATLPLAPHHYMSTTQFELISRLQQQLAEQRHQNEFILLQMQTIKNQLEAEHVARINAEVHMQDLIKENQNLLFRIHSMMRQLLKNDLETVQASSKDDISKLSYDHLTSKQDVQGSFDAAFFNQSPDSGHDDTISSTLSRLHDAGNTWSSASRLQLVDETFSVVEEKKNESDVIENYNQMYTNVSSHLPNTSANPSVLPVTPVCRNINNPKNVILLKNVPVTG